MSLTCDINHRYSDSLTGREYPSVTQVIRHFAPSFHAGDFYLQKGRAVHAAISLAVRNLLDHESVDPRIIGRVKAILKFISEAKLTVIEQEHSLASTVYHFAGTPDAIASLPNGELVIVDWKASVDDAVSVQLGGYSLLARQEGFKIARAAAVVCKDDESVKCHWLTRRELDQNERVFLAMLTVYSWQKKHGVKAQ